MLTVDQDPPVDKGEISREEEQHLHERHSSGPNERRFVRERQQIVVDLSSKFTAIIEKRKVGHVQTKLYWRLDQPKVRSALFDQ